MEELKEAFGRLGGLHARHPDALTQRLYMASTWAAWVLVGVLVAMEADKVVSASSSPALSTTLVKQEHVHVPAVAVVLVDDRLVLRNVTCLVHTLVPDADDVWQACDWSRSKCVGMATSYVQDDTCLLDGSVGWMGAMPPLLDNGEYAAFHKTTFVQQNQMLVVAGAEPRHASADDPSSDGTVRSSPPMVTFHNPGEIERAYAGEEFFWTYIPEDTVVKYVTMGRERGVMAYYYTPSVIRRITGDEEWTYDFDVASSEPNSVDAAHYAVVAIPGAFNVPNAEEYISYGVSDAMTAIGGAVGFIGAIRAFFFTTKNDSDENDEITYLRFSKAWRRRDTQVLREELLQRPADPTYE